jgi:capsular polysaccharide biosynthesis protein
MEETISIQEFFKILRKRIVLIVSVSILAVTLAGVVSYFFLTPIYQASTQILITQQKYGEGQFNSQDIEANIQLINTYNVIIKSPAILSKVIKSLDLDTTPDLLEKKIKVNSAQNSQVVDISVEDPELYKAVDIANTTADVFQKEIRTLMNIDNVSILSPAVHLKNSSPLKPNPILNITIAAVIGMMIGVGIAFLLEYLNTTIKTERDIEDLLAVPILGLVSPITDKDLKSKKGLSSRRRKRGL